MVDESESMYGWPAGAAHDVVPVALVNVTPTARLSITKATGAVMAALELLVMVMVCAQLVPPVLCEPPFTTEKLEVTSDAQPGLTCWVNGAETLLEEPLSPS